MKNSKFLSLCRHKFLLCLSVPRNPPVTWILTDYPQVQRHFVFLIIHIFSFIFSMSYYLSIDKSLFIGRTVKFEKAKFYQCGNLTTRMNGLLFLPFELFVAYKNSHAYSFSLSIQFCAQSIYIRIFLRPKSIVISQ